MTTTERQQSTTRGGRRYRAVAAALGCALLAGAVAAGGAPTAEAAEAVPVPTAIAIPSHYQLSTPANLRVRGIVTVTEAGVGTLTVTLRKPVTGTGAPCSGAVHTTRSVQTLATAVPTTTSTSSVVSTTTTLPATTVPVTYSVEILAAIKSSDPQGEYHWEATFRSVGSATTTKSDCGVTLVAHRDNVPNPTDPDVSTVQGQVTRQFRNLLGRAPSASELSYWSDRITTGVASLGDVVANLRGSDDHAENVDPAVRLYSAYFLRTPDASGLNYWIGQLRGGRSLIWASDFFSQSPEFQRRYGSLSNAQFVDLIYQNILERGGDSNGRAFWNAQLDQGLRSRGDVMVGFSESPEYKESMANEVHVAVLYALLLGRAPSATELKTTVELLDIRDTPLPFTVADLADDLLED